MSLLILAVCLVVVVGGMLFFGPYFDYGQDEE